MEDDLNCFKNWQNLFRN